MKKLRSNISAVAFLLFILLIIILPALRVELSSTGVALPSLASHDIMLGTIFGRSKRSGVWGFVAGGAVGLAIGMLLAPQEGRKTQRRLVYQLDQVAGQVSALADNLLHKQEMGEARRSGDALVADARERAQRIQDDIDRVLAEMRHPAPPSPSE